MLEKELDIVRIVKNLRTIKLMLKAKGIWTELSKLKTSNYGKNLLELSDENKISHSDKESIDFS